MRERFAKQVPALSSFPRRRESIVGGLVPRLRGEDGLGRDLDVGGDFAQALCSIRGFGNRIVKN